MNDTLLKYVKEKLAEQRSICADAFWNNYFNWIDNVPNDKIKALMQFIEAVDEPNLGWLKSESLGTVYKECLEILKELVTLKIMKDEFGKSNHYEMRKNQAWQKAKDFINKNSNENNKAS